MGDATDSVIMPRVLQGRGSVATDLVDVSAANLGLSVNDMLVQPSRCCLAFQKQKGLQVNRLSVIVKQFDT